MLTDADAATSLPLQPMRADHVARAMDLVRMAGWNQTEADWRLMLAIGEGYGVEDEHGVLLASSIVLPYAPGVGWIGMVLVDEAVRRLGLATRLLRNAIAQIQSRSLAPMLDATPPGREVYARLGFRDVESIGRWRACGAPPRTTARNVHSDDAMAEAGIAADAQAFGADRRRLLADFRARPGAVALSMPQAWLWSRAGRTATQIGPVIAERAIDAIALCEEALDRIEGPVLLDVPDRESELITFLRARGFALERPLTRMALGTPPSTLGRSMRVIAGPELG